MRNRERPIRPASLEREATEIGRHCHCDQDRHREPSHEHRIAIGTEHRERQRAARDRADAVSRPVEHDRERDIGKPVKSMTAAIAMSVVDAIMVHDG